MTNDLIGSSAKKIDGTPLSERLKLDNKSSKKLGILIVSYAILILLSVYFVFNPTNITGLFDIGMWLFPIVIFLAFIFETLDSAAGMGFGTALSPLLLAMGYDPLAVVPVLLISESFTGLLSAAVHHEFENIQFSTERPINEATRLMLMIAGFGVVSVIASVILTYFAIEIAPNFIKTYVAILVLAMGAFAIFRRFFNGQSSNEYKPKRMIGYALFAGFNKGIGGGGYGPVVTLGEIHSGVYEKSAAAITSLAEGLVSIVGIVTFFGISMAGVDLHFKLLPSVLVGSVLAAIASPYIVRVLPNRIFSYVIPVYAFIVGVIVMGKLYIL